jgi:2'-hydroxyisoflavone reductase
MHTTRRDLLKFAGVAAAGAMLAPALRAYAGELKHIPKAAKPLNLLILGGTGFTGPFQVAYALARGHKVTLFNRGKRPSPEWPGEVEQLFGDRNNDLKSLEGDRTWDACMDNPTSIPVWVRDAGKVLKGRVGQYVFISTISVYADNSTPGADESAPLATYKGKDAMAETRETLIADIENLYGPLKALSEAEAEKWFPGQATIIRPGYIVGPRDDSDRFTYWPLRIREGGEVLVPGDGSDPMQVIDARDLAEWTIRMVENKSFGIYNATGPDFERSTDATLYGIQAATGGNAKLVHVPIDFLEAQKVVVGGDLPIFAPGTGETAGFHRVSVKRAVDQGLTYRPLATTVHDLLAWWDKLPAERRAKPNSGITRERQNELLKLWRAKKA